MKKMNILLSALSLAVVMLTPMASFAETGGTPEGSGTSGGNTGGKTFSNTSETMVVSQEFKSEYTIIIPEGTQKLEEGLDVGAKAFLKYNEKLVVSVDSNNGWVLKDTNTGNEEDISYTLTVGDEEVTKNGPADIFEVKYTDENMRKDIVMELADIDDPTYAGTYTDTLTFTARMESVTGTNGEGGNNETGGGNNNAGT